MPVVLASDPYIVTHGDLTAAVAERAAGLARAAEHARTD